jgi:hypothetical protein
MQTNGLQYISDGAVPQSGAVRITLSSSASTDDPRSANPRSFGPPAIHHRGLTTFFAPPL